MNDIIWALSNPVCCIMMAIDFLILVVVPLLICVDHFKEKKKKELAKPYVISKFFDLLSKLQSNKHKDHPSEQVSQRLYKNLLNTPIYGNFWNSEDSINGNAFNASNYDEYQLLAEKLGPVIEHYINLEYRNPFKIMVNKKQITISTNDRLIIDLSFVEFDLYYDIDIHSMNHISSNLSP